MAFKVTIVTGPRRSGKTEIIRTIIDEVCKHEPHYIRLAALDGTKRPPKEPPRKAQDCHVATATWINYDPNRVFEAVPRVLTAVHRKDADACVIMEGDTDPSLRSAYPYDYKLFVMPAPWDVHDVFRTDAEAEDALQSVLNDTVMFTKEIYGISADDDSISEGHERRKDMSDSQIGVLMRSPLGQELAARIRCQPEYHGVAESDIVVVNTGVGGTTAVVDEVVQRLEKLVRGSHTGEQAHPQIFCCDICDADDPRRQRLIERLHAVYQSRA